MALTSEETVRMLSEKSYRISGEEAYKTNILAARAIAEVFKSTLGPRGMEKMLIDQMGEVVISNDGAAILKKLHLKHPCAKIMATIGETQEREAGDGTKTAVILAGELLAGAERLLDKNIHPMTIVKGYAMAQKEATKILKDISRKISVTDKDLIRKIASTSLNSKISHPADRNHLVDLAVKAVSLIKEEFDGKLRVDKENINIQKQEGGSIRESEIVKGIVFEEKERVDPQSPKIVDNAKILLVNTQMTLKRMETDAKLDITRPEEMRSFLEGEKEDLEDMVRNIIKVGANCIFNFKTIDEKVQRWLARGNVFAAKRIPEEDLKLIARATGAEVVTYLADLTSRELGKAKRVRERKIGAKDFIFIEGCQNPRAVTIFLRGEIEHVLEEVGRAVDDTISVVKDALEDDAILPGGGATEVEVARRLRKIANKVGGREQLAINEFANALEVIPQLLAENSGFNPIDMLPTLRSEHEMGNVDYGVDISTGKSTSMFKTHVIEPLRVKQRAIKSAAEAAITIIRVDDVIGAKAPIESKETREEFKKAWSL